MPLLFGRGDQGDLRVIETEILLVELLHHGALRLGVWKKKPCRTALEDGIANRRVHDVRKRLGRHHDGAVVLSKDLEPLAELVRKEGITEREPRLVDEQQRRPTVELCFDVVKEIEKRRVDDLRTHVHEVLDLEDGERRIGKAGPGPIEDRASWARPRCSS